MKYNHELDVVSDNSLSMITKMIMPYSTILEFGPANGRLTEYLKKEKKCKVYIVEIDEKAGLEAAQYAEDYLIGDIEKFEWIEKFRNIKFDCAVFADVLEHLYDPKKVLEKVRGILKYDGSLIASIPNIAHNAVIIDLMNNKFEYKSTGLLDNTHIRFFTINGLETMLRDSFFTISQRYAVSYKVGDTEFENSYTSVKDVMPYVWKNREFGEIYQFVYEAKVSGEAVSEECSFMAPKLNHYFVQFFVDYGSGFNESIAEIKWLAPGDSDHRFSYNLDNTRSRVQKIRFDPLNENCIIEIKALVGITETGEQLNLEVKDTNSENKCGNIFCFLSNDPQINIDLCDRIFKKIEIELQYIHYDSSLVNINNYILDTISREFMQKEKQIKQDILYLNEKIKQTETELEEKMKQAEVDLEKMKQVETDLEKMKQAEAESEEKAKRVEAELEEKIKQLNVELESKTLNISELQKIIKNSSDKLDEVLKLNNNLLIDIKNIYDSKSWKLVSLIRTILRR